MATAVKKAWFHVDMDGLSAIYRACGREYGSGADRFYLSAVENSLEFFERERITATYFVIANDLDDPAKLASVRSVLTAGHNVACHGLEHRYLYRCDSASKRAEIVDSKKKIEDVLGLPCEGFRAPGYSIDFESLELLSTAGYRFDSSVFPTYAFRKRLGVQRLLPEPFQLFPESRFFEIPLPAPAPGLPPFHPCYAFYLGAAYFRRGVTAFARQYGYLTMLFHLTDFATPQSDPHGLRLRLFTNSYFSRSRKLRFLSKLVGHVRRSGFAFTTTEEFLRDWPESAPDLTPRTILGISTTHETGACIVRDGEVVAAISEERLTRRKLDNRYPPVESIREVIRLAGIEARDIDAVAVAGLHWRDLLPQSLDSTRQDVRDYHAFNDYFPHFCRLLYRVFYFWRALGYERVLRFLRKEYAVTPKLFHVEHHEAHAASAYRTGPTDHALIVTADGVGDDVCMTFSRGTGATIRRERTYFYPHSLGQFYTACTQVLGFRGGRHEGKITGLAGFGKPDPRLLSAVENTFFAENGNDRPFRLNKRYYAEGFVRLRWKDLRALLRGKADVLDVDYRNYKRPLAKLLRGRPREDVAYAFQNLLEREMVNMMASVLDGRRMPVVLAGGVFANVKLNMAVSQQADPEPVYIYPAMGDGGLCVGAALSVSAAERKSAATMYLGTGYGEEEIRAALADHQELRFDRPEDMAAAVADALVGHGIVARFDGRMEFGPRALGNRSILYHAGDRSVNAWLNEQLARTEFMPFAPICLYEDAEEYFLVREGEKQACEFMTMVVRCTDRMVRECPAAVHVDGTARPQLLRREVNPGMYDILQEYRRRTGISCVINTSFNMHEEPIVRTPDEAIRSFVRSNLHVLVLGPFLVRQ